MRFHQRGDAQAKMSHDEGGSFILKAKRNCSSLILVVSAARLYEGRLRFVGDGSEKFQRSSSEFLGNFGRNRIKLARGRPYEH
jgi:hypothetical protein